MTHLAKLLSLAAALPLGTSLLLFAAPERLRRGVPYVPLAAVFVGLALAILSLAYQLNHSVASPVGIQSISMHWLSPIIVSGEPHAATPSGVEPLQQLGRLSFGIATDSIAVIFFVLILLLGVAIHIFSMGYLHPQRAGPLLYSLLSMLGFSLLAAVISSNLLEMIILWGIGALCIYLICEIATPRDAARRLGSSHFFLMLLLAGLSAVAGCAMLALHGSFAMLDLFNQEGHKSLGISLMQLVQTPTPSGLLHYHTHHLFWGFDWLNCSGLLFVVAAAGLSAQFPFQFWPAESVDAPAPFNAILQGAMVSGSGAFLLARVYPVLTLDVRLVLAIIGCTSLVTGLLVALVQSDLKKVLCWTSLAMSGFTFLFFGVGDYSAALLYALINTVAFAGLFLCAGSALNSTRGERDLRRLGGLARRIPITAGLSLIIVMVLTGTIYLAGGLAVPPGVTALYDYASAMRHYGWLLFWLPVCAWILLSVVLWRWWWLIFGGQTRNPGAGDIAGDSAKLTLPLLVVATLAVFISHPVVEIKTILARSAPEGMIAPIPQDAGHSIGLAVLANVKWAFVLGPIAIISVYAGGLALADKIRRFPGVNLLYMWLYRGMFFRELAETIIAGGAALAARMTSFVDRLLLSWVLMIMALGFRGIGLMLATLDARVTGPMTDPACLSVGNRAPRVLATKKDWRRIVLVIMLTALILGALMLYAHMAGW
ncbi:MAG: hypothetical protein HKL96_09545 [Phycisphaerales bacterium]|nr:hypothetical protein [Phycisphaerales bacterium]